MGNPVKTVLKITRSYGMKAGGIYLLNKLGQKTCNLVIEYLVSLPVDQVANVGPLPDGLEARWLTPTEVQEFAQQDKGIDLTPEFAERANEYNRCFGVLAQGRLVNYGWYALHQIEPEHFFKTGIQFPPDLVFMHKGFTHPEFRGRRLHAIAMQQALQSLAQQGVRGLISNVDWTNYPSLKSCDRLGYQRLGRLIQISLFGRCFIGFPSIANKFGITRGCQSPSLASA